MDQLMSKYQKLCLEQRKVIYPQDFSQYFSQSELNGIYNAYGDINTFFNKSTQAEEFYQNNEIMFTICQGCSFYTQCRGNTRAKCKDNQPPMDFDHIEFIGDEKLLKWFYLNSLLYLHENAPKSRAFGGFFEIFKSVKKIKIKKKFIIMYSERFQHYERVKNAQFLSYQGATVESALSQILYLASGQYYEFYFDNITNDTEIKSPIEEKMFKALDNHSYLRKRYKFTLEQQHIISDAFGNVMFTLDFLMNIENKFKLCIEVDGYNYHSDPERFDLDRRRDRTLLKKGIYTARFSSHDVNFRLDDSLQDIIDIIEFHMHKLYH